MAWRSRDCRNSTHCPNTACCGRPGLPRHRLWSRPIICTRRSVRSSAGRIKFYSTWPRAADRSRSPAISNTNPACAIDAAVNGQPRPSSLKRLIAALGLAKAKETLHKDDWVVLVADETTLDLDQATQLLQQLEHPRRFLLIWCGSETPTSSEPQSDPVVDTAAPAPMGAAVANGTASFDREGLLVALTRLKAQSTAAVLDLQLRQAFLGPAFANSEIARPAGAAPLSPAPAGPRCGAVVEALWRLAADDRRVVIVSLDADVPLAPLAARLPDRYFQIPVADADALAWCAGLSAGGCRPVLCVGDRALVRSWPTLAEEICRPQCAVKIVVLASNQSEGCESPSGLDMLRILPGTPLLVPRDGRDLDPMFKFAAAL